MKVLTTTELFASLLKIVTFMLRGFKHHIYIYIHVCVCVYVHIKAISHWVEREDTC